MTAIASFPVTLAANPLLHDTVPVAYRRLQAQLTALGASDYSPERLVLAVAEFCGTRRSGGVPPAQVLIECTTLAAAWLDNASVRLIEVLAQQSLGCSATEELRGGA